MIWETGSGVIALNNKNSLVDRCLIESNVSANNGTVFMNVLGGKISKSVIRNNNALTSAGGAINATSSNTVSSASVSGATVGDMLAVVENCLIYNNTAATGGAIRCSAQSGKRGIQIINTTIVNNKTTTANSASVVLTNSGAIANSLVVNPTNEANYDILTSTANSYLVSTIYNDESYTTGGLKNNLITGKVTSDIGFKSATANTDVMIPSYTASFNQTVYDAIRQANFKIDPNLASASPVIITTSLKTMPANYTYSGSSSPITFTGSIPTTDLMGVERPITTNGHLDLGAYQFSSLTTSWNSTINTCKVFAVSEGIQVLNSKGEMANIYNFAGQLLKSECISADNSVLKVNKGLYLVKVGSKINKVIVK